MQHLLMRSIHSTQAPQGLKRNLERNYDSWTTSITKTASSPARLQVLFVLAWFHAVVQERRNYVPQGWLKKHEFNESDLKAALDILEHITQSDEHSTGLSPVGWLVD